MQNGNSKSTLLNNTVGFISTLALLLLVQFYSTSNHIANGILVAPGAHTRTPSSTESRERVLIPCSCLRVMSSRFDNGEEKLHLALTEEGDGFGVVYCVLGRVQ